MHFFYLQPGDWPSDLTCNLSATAHCIAQKIELSGQEAHHLSRVLRLKQGECVIVLDGDGREAKTIIQAIRKNSVELHIENVMRHSRPEAKTILAVGWGKAARRGWIFEKAVELGASELWFWQAERSQFSLPGEIKENWMAQLIAGLKQCRNPWLPKLRAFPGGVDELLGAAHDMEYKQLLVENDYPHQDFLTESKLGLAGRTICVVGPEGGFCPLEIEKLILAGFTALSMGDRILRWETAAILALGLHWWKKQTGNHGLES